MNLRESLFLIAACALVFVSGCSRQELVFEAVNKSNFSLANVDVAICGKGVDFPDFYGRVSVRMVIAVSCEGEIEVDAYFESGRKVSFIGGYVTPGVGGYMRANIFEEEIVLEVVRINME